MKIYEDGIEREATENEIAEITKHEAEALKQQAAEAKTKADKAQAKQVVLDRLGITADEAALLLG